MQLKDVTVEMVIYCKTVFIWSHGPCVDAAAHRSNTSCRASVLVFFTKEGGKKIAFSDRFTIIWPKVRVDENCITSNSLIACCLIIVVILLRRYSIEITEKQEHCYSELAGKNKRL